MDLCLPAPSHPHCFRTVAASQACWKTTQLQWRARSGLAPDSLFSSMTEAPRAILFPRSHYHDEPAWSRLARFVWIILLRKRRRRSSCAVLALSLYLIKPIRRYLERRAQIRYGNFDNHWALGAQSSMQSLPQFLMARELDTHSAVYLS
jgi:hypothetical protein